MNVVRTSFMMLIGFVVCAGLIADASRAQDLRARQVQNDLKQISIAWHMFHDKNGSFPTNISQEGRPLLSWRVALLPYLEGEEGKELHKQFKLDEPWDSEHNIKLLDKMPAVYRGMQSPAADGHFTGIVAPSGKGYIMHDARPARMRDILDGTSNTIALVATDTEIPWTKPVDLPITPELTVAKLCGDRETLLVALADGSVRMLPKHVDAEDWQKMLTISGREPVSVPDVRVPDAHTPQRAAMPPVSLRVIDEAGEPVAEFEAMWNTADKGNCQWIQGSNGRTKFYTLGALDEIKAIDLLVRADGYAPAIVRLSGEEIESFLLGKYELKLERGEPIRLRFRMPEGMEWPAGLQPEVYFVDMEPKARMMRNPNNRERRAPEAYDFHLVGEERQNSEGISLRLDANTPAFKVAVHAPGFLQGFEAGPFQASDAKEGVIDITIPRPAKLELSFEVPKGQASDLPFDKVGLMVGRQYSRDPGFYPVVNSAVDAADARLTLDDIAPGDYLVIVSTVPREPLTRADVMRPVANPARFFDRRQLELAADATEQVTITWRPLDESAYRGDRTAVLKITRGDGTPAVGKKLEVSFNDPNYGPVTVYAGETPESGEVVLENISERKAANSRTSAYTVSIDGKRVGGFDLTGDAKTQSFDFQAVPDAGELSPNVELTNLTTGEKVRLHDFAGQLVVLDFWATWCGPCQPAMEKLSKLTIERADDWKGRVRIVPVSIDNESAVVAPHLASRGWENLESYWTGAEDQIGWQAPALRAFGVSGVPTSFLIGPDGVILWRGHPMSDENGLTLEGRVDAALAELK